MDLLYPFRPETGDEHHFVMTIFFSDSILNEQQGVP